MFLIALAYSLSGFLQFLVLGKSDTSDAHFLKLNLNISFLLSQ